MREGMKWFWDQYTTDETERAQITASPLRATLEQLAGLPPALVITAEADVLREEGEAYAAKLRAAGVPTTAVRYGGIIHDFVMLNALHDTYAAKAAINQASDFLRAELHGLRPRRPGLSKPCPVGILETCRIRNPLRRAASGVSRH